MPNRILRPWLDSEAVNRLSDSAEVFFVRLIMAADDFGRYYGDPKLLRSYLYPLRDKVPNIGKLIEECVKAGLIADYTVNHKHYLQIIKFGQRMRVYKSKFPEPPQEIISRCGCKEPKRKMTVTCQSHDGQMTDTCQSHDSPETRDERRETRDENILSLASDDMSQTKKSVSSHKKYPIFFDYDGDRMIHGITPEDIAYWRNLYPAVDIEQELKSMTAWLDSNRQNRKTDVKRFIGNWLIRRQDRAPLLTNQRNHRDHTGI